MKIAILLICIMTISLTSQAQINIPALSPRSIIRQEIGLAYAVINYGRPSLKGRKMLGKDYIPFGKVWRFGANMVTTLELTDEMLINGQPLAKGKYAMVAVPGAAEWTIIINSNGGQWGVYDYKEAKDVLRFNVKAEKLSESIETVSFTFEDIMPTSASIVFRWENTKLKFSLVHQSDEKVMAEIKEKTSKENPSESTLMEAAEYYLLMNRDLEQAFIWSTKVLEMTKSPFRFNLKAQIAEKLGKCSEATEAAKGAIEYAEKNGDVAAITLAKRIIKGCKGKNK
jgi:Protein of unknown function (DUF2911)